MADHDPASGSRVGDRGGLVSLTGYMVGMIGGVLIGGWVADRTERHLPFVVVLTSAPPLCCC